VGYRFASPIHKILWLTKFVYGISCVPRPPGESRLAECASALTREIDAVKRDWDVVRAILTEVEALSPQERHSFTYGLGEACATHDPATSEHALLLYRAGYLAGIPIDVYGCSAIMSPELTWAGHDLLDTIRSNAVWERIKTLSQEKGIELTFDAVKTLGRVAVDWVLAQ
jgi:hypothetical protein